MKNKLSIITVCYNCEELVDETLSSLTSQTFKDFEYIVVDGFSTDNTCKRIRKYSSNFDKMTIISEKDSGIYDAMNKGISAATGDFIYFLNIGDRFYNNFVLENIVNLLESNDVIYYGDVIADNKLIKNPKKISNFYILKEKMICHQTIFSPKKFLENMKFDLKYKYCADRDWFLKCIKEKKCKYKHIDLPVAIYDSNGFSSNKEKVSVESKKILGKYYPKFIIKILKIKNSFGKLINR